MNIAEVESLKINMAFSSRKSDIRGITRGGNVFVLIPKCQNSFFIKMDFISCECLSFKKMWTVVTLLFLVYNKKCISLGMCNIM